MGKYSPSRIEPKWQKLWKEKRLFSPDLSKASNPFYNLMMFPYPSAEGLHVGNMYAFTGADVFGRAKRMQGFNVFQPIGLDGFGIHSENFALKIGEHPMIVAERTQKNFYRQLYETGISYDWTKTLETYDPDYYRWTQWLFVKMFKDGLAYRKKAFVNWCPSCKTVLADEQVEGGVCERCKTETVRKGTRQWFFRITKYTDRLLANLEKINWPEKIKVAQKNWIGKSEGVVVKFKVADEEAEIEVFTTRLDTLYGVTFLVLAPEHWVATGILSSKFQIPNSKLRQVKVYIQKSLRKTEQQRKIEERKKSGIDTNRVALHPLTGEKLPIWIADFVLMEYGTGAVMGVPAHDERDFDFAVKYNLPFRSVIQARPSNRERPMDVMTDDGTLIDSDKYTGLTSEEARKKILSEGQRAGWAKVHTSYHLRDWLISRQRYWGPPIPIIYCRRCWQVKDEQSKAESMEGVDYTVKDGKRLAIIAVPEKDLPVRLPRVEKWKPLGTEESPLAQVLDWVDAICPQCNSKAMRETDVSDTFLDSSWYFLAYPNLGASEWQGYEKPFNERITRKWLPVDVYVGGAEHAVLHLLYSRFVTMVLHDLGYLPFEEPFPFLFSHGLLIKGGAKMSKSRGNVVVPDDYTKKYGADTLRMYLMFLGPFDQGGDFQDTGVRGIRRFLDRVWEIYFNNEKVGTESQPSQVISKLHQTIQKVGEAVSSFKFNTAIAFLMEFLNDWRRAGVVLSYGDAGVFLRLLAPFAPHLAEELWQYIKARHDNLKEEDCYMNELAKFESIHQTPWPQFDQTLIEEREVEIVVQINGRVRDRIKLSKIKSQKADEVKKKALQSKKVSEYFSGRKIKDVFFVPGRLINLVTVAQKQ